nr:Chain C, Rhoptry neck protein 2 [Plasmodium falciparum]
CFTARMSPPQQIC